ncbi:MAG: hypothetical protein IJD95_04240 [Clostridia bacterium]|nr:hypothetical protein [Clostridia bacterium]
MKFGFKKMVSLAIAALLCAAGLPAVLSGCSSVGTTYYISSSEGNDENDGLSPKSAWKSFSHTRDMRFTEGDKILLKCGDEWNETLYIHANGTEKNWVKVSYYGDIKNGKPSIKLKNGRSDICIVAEDCATKSPYANGLNYIHIDGIECRNARMGIYFRYYFAEENRGVKVTNCDFYCMDYPELFSKLTDLERDEHLLAEDMAAGKDSLSSYNGGIYRSSGGGVREMAWPAAIMIGGNYLDADSDTINSSKVSDITIDGCVFQECLAGISSWFWGAHDLTGNVEKRLTNNWRITDCVFDGTLAGAITIENGNGGFTGDKNGWGVIENFRLIGGHEYKCIYGSTGACFQTCKNFFVNNCEFSYVNNNGSNDGCGWDFEGSDYNVIYSNNVLHNNEAHAILMMQAVGPCKDVTLSNLLFYNNILNPANSHYNADFTLFNAAVNHKNILFENTKHFLINSHKVTGERPLTVNSKFKGLTTENVSDNSVDDYFTRFGFNKDGSTDGFIADKVTGLCASGGALRFTTVGKNSAVYVGNLGVNQLLYTELAVKMTADKSGTATVYYTTLESSEWQKGGSFKYQNGEGVYTASVDATSPITAYYIRFGSDKTNVSIDYVDAVADVSASAKYLGDNRISYTVSGKAFPIFFKDVSAEDFVVSGATVKDFEYTSYNTVTFTLKEDISGSLEGITVKAKPEAFTEYFTDLFSGKNGCTKTPDDEAALRGYSEVQKYFEYDLTASVEK